MADILAVDIAAETGQDSGGCWGGERASVPATAGKRAPTSPRPKRGHLLSESSFLKSTSLDGRGSDLLLVLRLVGRKMFL